MVEFGTSDVVGLQMAPVCAPGVVRPTRPAHELDCEIYNRLQNHKHHQQQK